MADRATAPDYEIASRSPIVVLVDVGDRRRLPDLAHRLGIDFPDRRFIGIVAVDDDEVLAEVLTPLHQVLAEVIFTASSSPPTVPGFDLATVALEVVGMGQDFVFTVPELSSAIPYAIDAVVDQSRRWDGSAIVVLGSSATNDEARRVLAAAG